MNRLILEDKYGRAQTLESPTLMFDLSDFIAKWKRLSGSGGFYGGDRDKWNEWKQYVRSNGSVGKLHDLMERYGVCNCRVLYNAIELERGEIMGIAHGEYLANMFEQKFQSPITARLEVDENGKKWSPGNDMRLPLISSDISDEVLSLLPMKDEDERTEWINKAITKAAVNEEWESLPFSQFYVEDLEKLNSLSRDVSEQVKAGKIQSIEDLKRYLLEIWIKANGPKIFI